MSSLARDGTAEPVSRDQIFRHERGQGNIHLPCSADHEQDWQPYPVDPLSAINDDHTHILHTWYTVPHRYKLTQHLRAVNIPQLIIFCSVDLRTFLKIYNIFCSVDLRTFLKIYNEYYI